VGCWMTYRRARTRGAHTLALLPADLDRMERDYLDPQYPQPPWATRPAGSSPAEECARDTGVDVDTVRQVLTYVFRVQP
jgi:hypothetical protein